MSERDWGPVYYRLMARRINADCDRRVDDARRDRETRIAQAALHRQPIYVLGVRYIPDPDEPS